jgi:hypothetical protein
VFAQIPLRESTTIEEDVQWGKEVLESGFKIQHEPSAIVFHAHNDSYFDLFGRNVDDGIANRKAVGLELDTTQVVPSIFARVRDDWHYLEQTCGLEGPELEHWQLVSALRRTAQIVGQWIGVNYEHMPANLARSLSLSGRTKAGLANPGHGTAAL